MRTDRITRWIVGGSGVSTLMFGLWALFAPRSFFETVATFEPFNAHLIHDLGAFQIGIGATLLVALLISDALMVVLAGSGVGAALHFITHLIDRDLGGRSTDPAMFGIVAAVVVGTACVRFIRTRADAA